MALAMLMGVAFPGHAADSLAELGTMFRPPAAAVPIPPAGGASAVPTVGSNGDFPGLRLVLTSPTRSAASIDGRIVHVGDMVDGMRVKRIDARGVELTREGGARERLAINPARVTRVRETPAVTVVDGVVQ